MIDLFEMSVIVALFSCLLITENSILPFFRFLLFPSSAFSVHGQDNETQSVFKKVVNQPTTNGDRNTLSSSLHDGGSNLFHASNRFFKKFRTAGVDLAFSLAPSRWFPYTVSFSFERYRSPLYSSQWRGSKAASVFVAISGGLSSAISRGSRSTYGKRQRG